MIMLDARQAEDLACTPNRHTVSGVRLPCLTKPLLKTTLQSLHGFPWRNPGLCCGLSSKKSIKDYSELAVIQTCFEP